MIKTSEDSEAIERYKIFYNIYDDRNYIFQWKSKIIAFYTCGKNCYPIECILFLPDTLTIYESSKNGRSSQNIELSAFNNQNPKEKLNFTCNCHGFTFANGKFCINNEFVPFILDDEYLEINDIQKINAGEFDVVCFVHPVTNEYIHSCKHLFNLFIHKEGIRHYSVHCSAEEILLIEEYKNCEIKYYKRRDILCHGICLNTVRHNGLHLLK